MSEFAQFSLPSLQSKAPALLMATAAVTAFLLTRPRHSVVAVRPRLLRHFGSVRGVVRWLIIGALTLVVLIAFGIDLQGLWSTAVAALSLLAIGFVAMWSILSHMLAAILIVVFRPFEFGDQIEIVGEDPVIGEVTDLNPVYTTLRTADGARLQIPNNLFFQKVLKRHVPAAFTRAPRSAEANSFTTS